MALGYQELTYLKSCAADVFWGPSTADGYCLGYTLGVDETPRPITKPKLNFFGEHTEVIFDFIIEVKIGLASIAAKQRQLFWKAGYIIGSSARLDIPLGLELGKDVRNILWIRPKDVTLNTVKYISAYPKPSGSVPRRYGVQIIYPVTFVCVRDFRTNNVREEIAQ